MRRGLCVLAGLLSALLSGCGLPPAGSQPVAVPTRDYGFVDSLLAGESGRPQSVEGHLLLPAGAAPPYPAVVLLHSSNGFGTLERHYAELLAGAGFAVLAVDSFGWRGVDKTIKDQTLVSEAGMLADAYGALTLLSADPRFDADRIALIGFSKGGTVALYAAFERMAAALAPQGPRFAAHAAFYPWCGLALQRPATTGRPVLVQIGGADEVTPPAACQALAERLAATDPAADLELVVYPGAGHAFDHPLLGAWGLPITSMPVRGMLPGRCRIEEQPDGRFVESVTGRSVTGADLAEVLALCGSIAGSVQGDEAAAAEAARRLLAFLRQALGGSRPS